MTEEKHKPGPKPKVKEEEVKLQKCEVMRRIFPEGADFTGIAPNELTSDELKHNAEVKKAGGEQIKPKPVYIELPIEIARKFNEVGAVKIVI